MDPAAQETVARVVVEADPGAVDRYLQGLVTEPATALGKALIGPPRTDRHTELLLSELDALIQRLKSNQSEIREAIAIGRLVRVLGQDHETRTTPVWTGPELHDSPMRATAQVVAELISNARSQILAVSYTLRPSKGRGRDDWLALLSEAVIRRVGVTVVVHQDQANRSALLGRWPQHVALPRLLTWLTKGDDIVKLHAKVLAVDDEFLLVTSSNLTYHGLYANLEFGVLVESPIAGDVRRHFDRLERAGHLVEWATL